MKIELFAVSLTLMYLTAHCNPVDVNCNDNGVRRSHRSNHAMVLVGYYGQSMYQEPQFNAQPDENGVTKNQETPIYSDENVQPDVSQQNVPIDADSSQNVPLDTTYDGVTEESNLDGTVTQNTEDTAKESPESDEEEYEDDEDEDLWNISKIGKKNGPAINFFPVLFGNEGNKGRSGGIPYGTVAIANSFSTGRRGVATSHANAGTVENTFRN